MLPRVSLVVVFASWSIAVAERPSLLETEVRAHFAAWDANANGQLEVGEIDRAIASPEFRGDTAAALVALKRSRKSAGENFRLEQLAAAPEKPADDAEDTKDPGKLFTWAQERIKGARRELFATQPPRIEALKQGKLGDCFCLAALRSLLQREPEKITRMITPQPDGTYRVVLGEKEVVVPPLTDGEIALGASAADGLWPLVYEKAVGISRMKPEVPDATPFNTVTKGGSAGSMMSVLSQNPIKRWSCQTWREASPEKRGELLTQLRADLRDAQAERRLVTGGTGAKPTRRPSVPGILYNHGYSVLVYDEAADTVRLWNPHADPFRPKGEPGLEHGYPMERGEFSVPLSELVQFFGGFAFEQHPASATSAR